MATEADLIQSIREATGELQWIELDESARAALAKIDMDLWDLVDDVKEEG